ncbi:hypothetical protein N0V88_003304 [Collariella sp. IMI 366227]|nr:hypothetical protein N0V88_003304 [Collariella sp. IMI 366227]
MSSNVAQKTTPRKKAAGDASETTPAAAPTTPRSPGEVPKYQSFPGHEEAASESQSGDYTHKDTSSKKKGKSKKKGGEEESEPEELVVQSKDELPSSPPPELEEGEGEIKMKDVEPKPLEEGGKKKAKGKKAKAEDTLSDVDQQSDKEPPKKSKKAKKASDDEEEPLEKVKPKKSKKSKDAGSDEEPLEKVKPKKSKKAASDDEEPLEDVKPKKSKSKKAASDDEEPLEKVKSKKPKSKKASDDEEEPLEKAKPKKPKSKKATSDDEAPLEDTKSKKSKKSKQPASDDEEAFEDAKSKNSDDNEEPLEDLDAKKAADANAEPLDDETKFLTESVKRAFDMASKNQPTDEARNAFLQAARGTVKSGKSEQEQLDEIEAASENPAEALEKATEVAKEEAPEASEKAGTEVQEKASEAEKATNVEAPDVEAPDVEAPDVEAPDVEAPDVSDKVTEADGADLKSMPDTEKTGSEAQEKLSDVSDKATEANEAAPELDDKAKAEEQPSNEGEKPEEVKSEEEAQSEGELKEGEAAEGEEKEEPLDFSLLKDGTVNKGGNIVSEDGKVVGHVVEGVLKSLVGKKVDENGIIWNNNGKQVGKAEPISDSDRDDMLKEPAPFENFPDAVVDKDGMVVSGGESVGKVVEGDIKVLRGKVVDADGDILDKGGNVVGKAERWEAEVEVEEEEDKSKFAVLKNGTVNKGGNVVVDGKVVGHIVEGVLKHLIGKKVDENGDIWSSDGKVIGKAEPIPDNEREEMFKEAAPFENFPDAVVDKDGMVISNGEPVGKVIEGDIKVLRGKAVDADGDILDKGGNVVGKAERWEPEPEEEEEGPDFSILKNGTVNKGGNVVVDKKVVGHVIEGALKHVIGKKVDENGNIWSSGGKIVGKAEPIPDDERDDMSKEEPAPFESFPDAVVDKDGMVISNGEPVGKIVKGDVKVLRGKSVDPDGDILDSGGNVIGKAERWEPEPEEEVPEVDKSSLAGKRVNKAGNVVDSNGSIFGRVIEGDAKRMVGRMCDKNGNILSESGDIIGKAELVSEGEREGLKEGPFAELEGCTVAKDGTVVTPSGDIVGRLTKGDSKILFGRAVDEDGDVLDKNGNVVGKAERWEPEPVEHKKNPMSGRRVNREGNVVDEDGNIIGKLTSGDLNVCSGKDIDDDGDVVDYKGNTIGHCTLLEDIPPEEPKEEESPEDKEKREQAEQDKKLAIQMAVCIEQCLESIRPICKMITEKIDKAERTPEDERDEEQLVSEVRPLIEEGGRILNEAKGIIKGLDPDGRIAANAKHKTAAREATPEEYRLADLLKDLTGDVTQCIDNAKRKLEDMPHAKKELNPLWGLLNEPLFQILAAVGLLLAGVLNLVGRLLSGLGLGGLVDGLLGTLGIKRVLESLGLGSFTKALGGGGKKKKSGGGLLGGVLGG